MKWVHYDTPGETVDQRACDLRQLEIRAHNLLAGEVAVHRHHPIKTTLGSCVAVCLHDPELHLIGMNHFLVPLKHSQDDEAGYLSGLTSMEVLLNAMLKAGAMRTRLQAKAFGGGDLLNLSLQFSMGRKNMLFAERWLAAEEIPLVACDWGGAWARKVILEPRHGDVYCQRLAVGQRDNMQALAAREKALAERLLAAETQPRIDYF
ncbi:MULTISPECIES: chemotaxis protein CheD [Chitinibacter]|uniref:chemotaxis protein CheD n=1 Tax=Chitinibacter TaxID=230666 RepID=UPI00068DA141|nr:MULTISPECIES: chemotaxis protein CheD [Chitinibacter]